MLHTLQALPETQAQDQIYDLYSGPTTATGYDPVRDRDELLEFLSAIVRFRDTCCLHGGIEIQVQGYGNSLLLANFVPHMAQGVGVPAQFLPACKVLCDDRQIPVPLTDLEMDELLEEDLWTNFYHFLSSGYNPSAIKRRIYIHCNGVESSLHVMSVCCGFLDHPSCRGLEAIKVAGPGCGGRLDTIVVYLTDDNAVKGFLDLYQLMHLPTSYLASGVPIGVKEVKTGIGIADEPPDIGLLDRISFEGVNEADRLQNREQQSFGSFLAKLMVIAMKNAGDETQFLSNLIQLFHIAHIDPANPHVHAGRRVLEFLNKQGMSAKWARRDK
jgi:hypothetical protein